MHNVKTTQTIEIDALPPLMTKAEIAKALCRTPNAIDQLRARDNTFPKPLREGNHRRARIYFVRAEIAAWLQSRLESREVAA